MDILQQNSQNFLTSEAILVLLGFFSSLLVGTRTHYVNLVKNHLYRYPNEWFPSVSSVIGDHFPARSIIGFAMALTATPRFLNIYNRRSLNLANNKLLFFDVLRTFSIGGWVYVTSCDSGSLHSTFMGIYVVSQSLYMIFTDNKTFGKKAIMLAYLGNILVMMTQLYSHRILQTPGAYSYYAILEWLLIPMDVAFDQWNIILQRFPDYTWKTIKDVHLQKAIELWSANLFWVNVTSLPAMLWYFPLWNMGLSGYEVVLISYFSPILLSLFWKNGMTNREKAICHSMAGLSFLTPLFSGPQVRLLLVAVATGASSIETFRENACEKLLTGLLSFSAVKFMNYSLHPLWPTMRKKSLTNMYIIAFHMIATGAVYYGQKSYHMRSTRDSKMILKSFAAGCGLWMLHTFFTDLETISLRYCYSSNIYKELFTLFLAADMAANVGLRNKYFFAATIPVRLYFHNDIHWTALADLTMTLCVIGIQDISRMSTDLTATIVICSTYVLLLLADVWTVAYAFVPFGNILRERSEIVMAAALVPGLVCVFTLTTPITTITRQFTKISKWGIYGLLFTTALSGMMQMNVKDNSKKLIVIKDKNILTLGIWTIHFGLDSDGYFSHDRMNNLIKKLDLDVVGLLESDTMRPIGGNRNLMKYMAHKMHMHYVYGPKPNDHTWGCSLLSKYPVVNSTFYLLPSPVGELACAIKATIKPPTGKLVDVLISHNGQEEDLLDRKLQTKKLAEISKEAENPLVFAGYLVTKPGVENEIYRILTQDGDLKDIYPYDNRRWCQYIMYKGIMPLAYARVSHGNITDTELQTAKFWVGGNVTQIELNDRNMYPQDLVKSKEESWNGHRYHMYKRPIYGDALFKARDPLP